MKNSISRTRVLFALVVSMLLVFTLAIIACNNKADSTNPNVDGNVDGYVISLNIDGNDQDKDENGNWIVNENEFITLTVNLLTEGDVDSTVVITTNSKDIRVDNTTKRE